MALAAAAISGAMLLLASLGPKRHNPAKEEPFECGVEPIEIPQGRLSIQFYVFAMLFIVFDVELVFFFPWAVLVRELGWFGLGTMGSFLLVVLAGFVYAWRRGALEWE